jgi:hypothetical protein
LDGESSLWAALFFMDVLLLQLLAPVNAGAGSIRVMRGSAALKRRVIA